MIRYKVDGELIEEVLGWSSENWTVEKAYLLRSKLKEAHLTGVGPKTLAEKRKIEEEQARQKELRDIEEKSRRITFTDFFTREYYPLAQQEKARDTVRREFSLYRYWLEPVIGSIPVVEVDNNHLETIKHNMRSGNLSNRSIQYAFAVIRQVWRLAQRKGFLEKPSPTQSFKPIKLDNKRLRYLNKNEADSLLSELFKRSHQLYEISLISLHCGLRANEIFSLTWSDIDFGNKTITVRDSKGKTRLAFMTSRVYDLFKEKEREAANVYVFKNKNGSKINAVSRTFFRTIDDLKFNEDIEDNRQKVVFHTLRHTYASWLVEGGTDLYTVKELMGHSTLAMTERYAHLGNGVLRKAVDRFEKKMGESVD